MNLISGLNVKTFSYKKQLKFKIEQNDQNFVSVKTNIFHCLIKKIHQLLLQCFNESDHKLSHKFKELLRRYTSQLSSHMDGSSLGARVFTPKF